MSEIEEDKSDGNAEIDQTTEDQYDQAIDKIMVSIKENPNLDMNEFEEPLLQYALHLLHTKQRYERADKVLDFILKYYPSCQMINLYQLYSLILQYKKSDKNKCEKKFQQVAKIFSKLKFDDKKQVLFVTWW